MKKAWILAAVGLTAISACANDNSMRVDCGATDVIVTQSQYEAMLANAGETDVPTAICVVANEVDSSSYSKPQSVDVTMPSGNQYNVKLQTSQQ